MSDRLTEAHRLAQARLGRSTVRQMTAIWPLLDPLALDQTFRRWLAAVFVIIEAQRARSAELAAQYVALHRRTELGTAVPAFQPVLADVIDAPALSTSMLVTGPVSVKANVGRGMRLDDAVDIGKTYSARAGMRHALDGGRSTLTRTAKADPRATAYERVTSGNPCAYCAGRAGIRFDTDEVFAPHDGCSCSAELIYR